MSLTRETVLEALKTITDPVSGSDIVAAGIVRAIAASPQTVRGEVVNLGNPDEWTVLEFARLIKELAASPSLIQHQSAEALSAVRQDDPARRCPDIGKAQRLLDWQPVVPLREGLARTIGWFRQTGQSAYAEPPAGTGLESGRSS